MGEGVLREGEGVCTHRWSRNTRRRGLWWWAQRRHVEVVVPVSVDGRGCCRCGVVPLNRRSVGVDHEDAKGDAGGSRGAERGSPCSARRWCLPSAAAEIGSEGGSQLTREVMAGDPTVEKAPCGSGEGVAVTEIADRPRLTGRFKHGQGGNPKGQPQNKKEFVRNHGVTLSGVSLTGVT
jgi:hypothetical protein